MSRDDSYRVLETRINGIEEARKVEDARHREDFSRLDAKLGLIQVSIEASTVAVQELKLRLATQPDQQATVKELSAKVEQLEEVATEARGMWKLVLVVNGALVTAGTVGAAWLAMKH